MAGDKEIVGYGKAKINGKYNITIEGYNYAKYGGNGCKAKLIYFAPIEKGSPLNKTTDVQNSKNGTKLEVMSGAYNDVLFQSKSFRNKNENLPINPQAPGNPSAIAYYKLVLQWPTGVCSGVGKKCKKSPWPGYFTIHGLWEVIKSTSTAQHSSDQFDSTKLIGLKKDLKNSWPTLELNTDESFWKHEWESHGVKSELGLVGYFQETLALYKKVGASLVYRLQAAGIHPDGVKVYDLKDIEAALNSAGSGIVKCVKHKTLNLHQIKEITFNFTPGLQQQPTEGGSPSCPSNGIRFPI
ncbi:hypothetical protein AQUCO_00500045v1 [Aquilegia coerulea]|uniref:Uncharacterized protein n=1 Tax=Aquilegia coerulea TaxID=218851 RepID=A0A2G5EQ59_AQUCA|nr:hypothetical protein AQUCO_00500045v1 [Aquilegia coerulea]